MGRKSMGGPAKKADGGGMMTFFIIILVLSVIITWAAILLFLTGTKHADKMWENFIKNYRGKYGEK